MREKKKSFEELQAEFLKRDIKDEARQIAIVVLRDIYAGESEMKVEPKSISCYVAKNKGEFDVENMSFYKIERKVKRAWQNEQEIKKVTIIFH